MSFLKLYAIKSRSRRSTSLEKRDVYSLNAMDRLNVKCLTLNISLLWRLFLTAKNNSDYSKALWIILLEEIRKVLRVLIVPISQPVITMKQPAMDFNKMEISLQKLGISCSER